MADLWRGLLRAANGAIRMNADPTAVASMASTNAADRFTRDLSRDSAGRLVVAINAAIAVEQSFTETTGAGVYTGTVALPAGATLLDVIVNGVAVWTATTSATLIVGDGTDPDGYYTGVDLKATDLLAGESLSFGLAGGKAGAYIANSQVSPRYAAAARSVIGVVTTVGAAGSAGQTRMTVVYAAPLTADVVAAAKV